MSQNNASEQQHDQANSSRPEELTCSVCTEQRNEAKPRIVDGNFMCEQCVQDYVVPLFQGALEHESKYPPKWGPIKLEIKDYASYFSPDFVRRYQRRELEAAATHRIFCQHLVPKSSKGKTVANASKGKATAVTPSFARKHGLDCE
jgi:hypothetical protein